MPFALILIGLLLVIAATKGKDKTQELVDLFKDDFTGSGNFINWVMAIVFLVLLGNIRAIKPVSDAFLVLIILVMIVANGQKGLFDNFMRQIREGTS
jgi:uncharacterized membrane protein YesL